MSNDDVHAKLAGINERLNYLNDEVTSIKSILRNHEKRVSRLEGKVDVVLKTNQQIYILIRYVILPLIIILGALVGAKLALP